MAEPPKSRYLGPLYRSFVVLALMAFDVFGIRTATDEISRAGFLKVYAPHYCSTAVNDIAVITFRDEDLRAGAFGLFSESERPSTSWPLTFDDRALMLRYLEAAQPAAVFLDLYMVSDNNGDPGLPRFLDALSDIVERGDMPLYLAEMPGFTADPVASQILPGILATGVRRTMVGWQDSASNYPLLVNTRTGAGASGGGPDAMRTAAADLYAKHLERSGRQLPFALTEAAPMRVAWGMRDTGTAPSQPVVCPGLGERIAKSISIAGSALFVSDETRDDWTQLSQHFFHQDISARDFVDWAENGVLANALRGKIVLVGADLDGIPDLFSSPIQGDVPGVHLHAMALDNLITLGPDYFREAPKPFGDRSQFDAEDLLELLVIGLSYFAVAYARGGLWFQSQPLRRRALILVGIFAMLSTINLTLMAALLWFNFLPANWLAILAVSVIAVLPDDEVISHRLATLTRLGRRTCLSLMALTAPLLLFGQTQLALVTVLAAALIVACGPQNREPEPAKSAKT